MLVKETYYQRCPVCLGAGRVQPRFGGTAVLDETCGVCQGACVIEAHREYEVEAPPAGSGMRPWFPSDAQPPPVDCISTVTLEQGTVGSPPFLDSCTVVDPDPGILSDDPGGAQGFELPDVSDQSGTYTGENPSATNTPTGPATVNHDAWTPYVGLAARPDYGPEIVASKSNLGSRLMPIGDLTMVPDMSKPLPLGHAKDGKALIPDPDSDGMIECRVEAVPVMSDRDPSVQVGMGRRVTHPLDEPKLT